MRYFLIEMFMELLDPADKVYKQFLVKAKDYSAACGKVASIEGNGEFKLLGVFQPMEIDKAIMQRIS